MLSSKRWKWLYESPTLFHPKENAWLFEEKPHLNFTLSKFSIQNLVLLRSHQLKLLKKHLNHSLNWIIMEQHADLYTIKQRKGCNIINVISFGEINPIWRYFMKLQSHSRVDSFYNLMYVLFLLNPSPTCIKQVLCGNIYIFFNFSYFLFHSFCYLLFSAALKGHELRDIKKSFFLFNHQWKCKSEMIMRF